MFRLVGSLVVSTLRRLSQGTNLLCGLVPIQQQRVLVLLGHRLCCRRSPWSSCSSWFWAVYGGGDFRQNETYFSVGQVTTRTSRRGRFLDLLELLVVLLLSLLFLLDKDDIVSGCVCFSGRTYALVAITLVSFYFLRCIRCESVHT